MKAEIVAVLVCSILTFVYALPGGNTVEAANRAVITEAARLPKELMKRDVSTCAFISGDAASPITCPPSYSCTKTINDIVAFACCNQIECPGSWRLCLNQGDEWCAGGEDSCSEIYMSVLSCSAANPYCFRYAYSSSLNAENTWFSYACGPSASPRVVLALATTTGAGGEGAAASTSDVFQGQNPTTASFGGNNIFTVSGNTVPTSSLGSTAASGSGSGGSQSIDSHLGQDAIIAIAVVASAVGVGLLLLIWWFCACGGSKRPKHNIVNPVTHGDPQHEMDDVNNENISTWGAGVRSGAPAPPSYYAGSEAGQEYRYPRRLPDTALGSVREY